MLNCKIVIAVAVIVSCIDRSNGALEMFPPKLDGRIVGGQSTTIELFPYQVSLRYYGSHRCGGTIIRQNIIITAAHCVIGQRDPKNYIIRAGITYRNSPGIDRQINRIIIHEQYNDQIMSNDIAILQLQSNLPFSTLIQPAELPAANAIPRDGTPVVVSGWGTLREGGQSPLQLQYVEVAVVNSASCRTAYKGFTNSMLCAGQLIGGRDSCQGDSGGPLVIRGAKNLLIGIVSYGYGCARPRYPGVYSNVAVLRQWIDNKLRNL